MRLRTLTLIYSLALAFGIASALAPVLVFADGSQSYTTPGTYTFNVPSNSTLTVQLWGAGGGGSVNSGGGGGAYNTATLQSSSLPSTVTVAVGAGGAGGANLTPGGAGGASSFGGYVAAYGGGGGAGYAGGGGGGGQSSAGGAPYCITENFGFCYAYSAGNGGDPSGGGGQAPSPYCTSPGNSTYGGGGGGNSTGGSSVYGGGGGGGGACGLGGGGNSTYGGGGGAPYFAYPHGSGSSYGSGGTGWNYAPAIGSSGTDGAAMITWVSNSPPPTPTCSVTFDENPLTDSSTTIHWTSTDATLFYINQVGYVGASGSATIYSAGDYSGAVSGPGGNGSCPATLQSPTNNNLCPDGSAAPNGDPNQCTCAQGNQAACTNSCPAGESWNGTQCIPGTCPAGELNFNGECVGSCPTGTTLENGQCIFTGCPAGETQSTDANGNPICILNSCPAGQTLSTDANGNPICITTSCPIGFVLQDGTCVFQGCPAGTTLEGSSCVLIPNAPPSGDIIAVPSIVKHNQTSNISWSAQAVSACTISGTNGDGWSCSGAACNATSTETSSEIEGQTIFTLSCTGDDSSTFTKSATIAILPGFCEKGAPGCN